MAGACVTFRGDVIAEVAATTEVDDDIAAAGAAGAAGAVDLADVDDIAGATTPELRTGPGIAGGGDAEVANCVRGVPRGFRTSFGVPWVIRYRLG